jgi:hypothetical protein
MPAAAAALCLALTMFLTVTLAVPFGGRGNVAETSGVAPLLPVDRGYSEWPDAVVDGRDNEAPKDAVVVGGAATSPVVRLPLWSAASNASLVWR